MNIKRVISYILVIAIFGFLSWSILKNWETILSFPWRFSLQDVFFALMFLLPIYLINVYSWHLVTKALGLDVTFSRNLQVWMYSNLARFLPGGFWQYPGRVLLLSREGVPKVVGATLVVLEAFFVLSVGSLITVVVFSFGQSPLKLDGLWLLGVVMLAFVLLITILGTDRIMTKIVQLLGPLIGKGEVLDMVRLPLKWVPILIFIFSLQFFFAGTVLFFLARGAVDLYLNLLPIFVGVFAASWILGYMTFFVPSGLGVQEASIAGLLSFYMPFSVAVMVAIVFRLALLGSEIFLLGLTFWGVGRRVGSV